MKYLTVGTDEIRSDLFRNVETTELADSMKPAGGMWFSEYNKSGSNEWVRFMMNHIYIWFYKNNNIRVNGYVDPFAKPCSLVSLKNDVHLYTLHNSQSLDYLMKYFPANGKFSYEELSKYYDGIYVDLNRLFSLKDYDNDILKKFWNIQKLEEKVIITMMALRITRNIFLTRSLLTSIKDQQEKRKRDRGLLRPIHAHQGAEP